MKLIFAAVAVSLSFAACEAQAQSSQSRPPVAPGTCMEANVYFTYGQDRMEQAALETVDALSNRLAGGPIDYVIVAHMDAAEGQDPGMTSLSEQRAVSVAAALARRPGVTFRLTGAGASQPAYATRPGVREPLNRRAAIRACRP
ncbi:MAG: OmpA family protein [Caulobacteraceae bacterium]|nr:OmpA family protein [Caulobacteraceae bacterium]